jgi:Receptor family ligand binding region
MHFHNDVIAFIGPACAFALEPVARLAAYWNTPIITGMGDQVRDYIYDLVDFLSNLLVARSTKCCSQFILQYDLRTPVPKKAGIFSTTGP